MKIIECEQGSPQWLRARLGMPTASHFHRIITPKTLKPSSQARMYAYELVAERILDAPLETGSSPWMERGLHFEEMAVDYYELLQDCETQLVGFCTTDDGLIGCSPDRLVGEDGGLEIKIPNIANHISHLVEDFEAEYKAQVQTCIYICEREWWDLESFNPSPRVPSRIIRCYRDDAFQAALVEALKPFFETLQEAENKIRAMMPATAQAS